ncbi:MAG: Ig-like domain-containing protein [Bacteroidales bacterium]|jgi:hypothetical protein|nr:Ig-like domain-containing protein [Bacteroidales bacterium]MCI1786037.1 Ig-like domain-containing protein [Bacteroidales bacterium]
MKKSILIPLVPVGLILGTMFFSPSCANTTTPPSGGPKDTIPPVLVRVEPKPGSVNVPVHDTRVIFSFDEYVTVKDQNCIFLSPPLAKQPKYKIKGKNVIVYFESDLMPNTTYALDITGAIADNNEGNKYPGFTETFSTGSSLDSMMLTGIVQDCKTLLPVKAATVMLYKDQSDSAVFKHRPAAAVKTDDWGFFCLRNIKDTVYRLYAIKDENHNNIYDPDNERIAFYDSIVKPSVKVNDSIPELRKYDMTDTLLCLARKAPYELNMFRDKPSKQMIVNKVRFADRAAYITFMAPGAKIDSMWIRNLNPKRLMTEFNVEKDSMEIWINDQRKMPDTLHLFVNYHKTDSLGILSPATEEVRLAMEKKSASGRISRRNIKHEDTTCVMTATAKPETVEQYGFSLEFKYPLIKADFDSLQFSYINPRQQEYKGGFVVTRDHENIRKYTVRPNVKLLPGYDYILKIPYRKFMDINGYYNDSTEVKVSLPKDDDLSSLKLIIKNTFGKEYIVDMLNEKRDKIIRSFIIYKDQTLAFPYLKAGKYSIRITEDPNENGIVDSGSLLGHRQPEKVKFYKIKNKALIDIPERTELEQTVDLSVLFE